MDTSNKLTSGAFFLLMLFVLILSVITVVVCFSIKDSVAVSADGTKDVAAVATLDSDTPAESPKVIYTLCVSDGVIAVKNAGGEVVRTLDTYVAFLPDSDREALNAGIPVYSEAELAALIEDYAG